MGYSWSLSGRASVGKAKLAAYRKAEVDPNRFEFPESWGEPNDCDASAHTVGDVIDILDKQSDAHEVKWSAEGIEARALFSNDSSIWLDMRSHVMSAFLIAADFGGEAEVAITGFLDGGPDDVFRGTARKDGTHAIDVLTAREARPIAARVHAEVQPLMAAVLATFKSNVDPTLPKIMQPLHARVCKALRACDGAKVIEAMARKDAWVPGPKGAFQLIQVLFPTHEALVSALENGWPEINQSATSKRAPLALRVLAEVDPNAARPIAAEIARLAVPRDKHTRAFVSPYVAQARALAVSTSDPKSSKSALAAMRKALPKACHFSLQTSLAYLPAVRALRDHPSAALRDLAREALAALVGAKKKLTTPAGEADQVYAYALTLVLEECGTDDDRARNFEIWTESKGFMLLDHARIMKSPAGRAFIAELYGRETRSHYPNQEQTLAAKAMLEIDPARCIGVTSKLLAKKKRAEYHEWAMSQLFEALGTPDKRWLALLEKASDETGDAGVSALGTLVKWKQKDVVPTIMKRLETGVIDVEQACAFFESLGDKSARAPLERWIAKLGKNEKRESNRARQTLSALAK